jgi:hypothetical protein
MEKKDIFLRILQMVVFLAPIIFAFTVFVLFVVTYFRLGYKL